MIARTLWLKAPGVVRTGYLGHLGHRSVIHHITHNHHSRHINLLFIQTGRASLIQTHACMHTLLVTQKEIKIVPHESRSMVSPYASPAHNTPRKHSRECGGKCMHFWRGIHCGLLMSSAARKSSETEVPPIAPLLSFLPIFFAFHTLTFSVSLDCTSLCGRNACI